MSFDHDPIKPYSAEGSKKQQVGEMFDRIAGRYDFMNRFLSAGIDQVWRRKAINQFRADKPQLLLDIATGTGDMAIMAARKLKPRKIIGIDISMKMLEVGQDKVNGANLDNIIELQKGDSEKIYFPDNHFDGAMVAFGVRNFENLELGIREILRVLKPGARLVVLEFSKPILPGITQMYNLYMGIIAPQAAKWFSKNKKAYQYLNNSVQAFPDRKHFTDILARNGFSETRFRTMTLGICCLYTARKPR